MSGIRDREAVLTISYFIHLILRGAQQNYIGFLTSIMLAIFMSTRRSTPDERYNRVAV